MTLNSRSKITLYSVLLYFALSAMVLNAEENLNISLGLKLLSSNWKGSNSNSGTDFERNAGGQFAWNIGLQKDRYYAGLSLQGGNYHFVDNGPEQVTSNTTTPVSDVKIQRSEVDLIAGYYFWDNISLFVDIKTIQNKFDKNNYKQNFAGLGVGIAGAWLLNNNWSLYGSFGFVGKGDLKANGAIIGSANSAALELGTLYRYTESHRFNIGFKNQGQKYTFNNGNSQTHKFGGLFIGYNYLFSL